MKNQIIQKFQSLETLKEKATRKKNPFFKPLDIKITFDGFKMSSLRCNSHVHEIILPKNMYGCPLKLLLGFLKNMFVAINENIHAQLGMNVKIHHHHMKYFKLNYSIFFT